MYCMGWLLRVLLVSMAESIHEDQLGWWEQNFWNTIVLNTAAFRCISYISRTISSLIQTLSLLTVVFMATGGKLTPLGTEPHFLGRVTWNHHQITLPVKSMHIWMHMVPWSHYFAHELEFHNNSRFHFHLIFTQPCFVNLLPHTLASLILSFDPHVTVVLSAGWWTFALDHGSWARRVSTGHTEDVSKSNFPNKPMRFFQENNRK